MDTPNSPLSPPQTPSERGHVIKVKRTLPKSAAHSVGGAQVKEGKSDGIGRHNYTRVVSEMEARRGSDQLALGALTAAPQSGGGGGFDIVEAQRAARQRHEEMVTFSVTPGPAGALAASSPGSGASAPSVPEELAGALPISMVDMRGVMLNNGNSIENQLVWTPLVSAANKTTTLATYFLAFAGAPKGSHSLVPECGDPVATLRMYKTVLKYWMDLSVDKARRAAMGKAPPHSVPISYAGLLLNVLADHAGDDGVPAAVFAELSDAAHYDQGEMADFCTAYADNGKVFTREEAPSRFTKCLVDTFSADAVRRAVRCQEGVAAQGGEEEDEAAGLAGRMTCARVAEYMVGMVLQGPDTVRKTIGAIVAASRGAYIQVTQTLDTFGSENMMEAILARHEVRVRDATQRHSERVLCAYGYGDAPSDVPLRESAYAEAVASNADYLRELVAFYEETVSEVVVNHLTPPHKQEHVKAWLQAISDAGAAALSSAAHVATAQRIHPSVAEAILQRRREMDGVRRSCLLMQRDSGEEAMDLESRSAAAAAAAAAPPLSPEEAALYPSEEDMLTVRDMLRMRLKGHKDFLARQRAAAQRLFAASGGDPTQRLEAAVEEVSPGEEEEDDDDTAKEDFSTADTLEMMG